jgi:1-acyl-sn-glycerol-3-phosphate acyltransferase
MNHPEHLARVGEGEPTRLARLATNVLASVAMSVGKYEVTGREHIPDEGGIIIAANHISEFDPAIFNGWIHNRVRSMPTIFAKEPLFKGLPGGYMRAIHSIPVLRGRGKENIPYFDAGVEVLKRGGAVVIYPEGTSYNKENFWPSKARSSGLGYLALNSGAPVVPIAQWGAQQFIWRDENNKRHVSFWPLPKPISLSVGQPLQFTSSESVAFDDTSQTEVVSNAVMQAITAQLAGLRGEDPGGYYARFLASTPEV